MTNDALPEVGQDMQRQQAEFALGLAGAEASQVCSTHHARAGLRFCLLFVPSAFSGHVHGPASWSRPVLPSGGHWRA